MKQTIAELGIGGTGWIIYNGYGYILPPRIANITVVNNWEQDGKLKTLMTEYLVRENINSNGIQTTRDLIVFGNEIVYSTKEEAEEEFKNKTNNTITDLEMPKPVTVLVPDVKNIDWKQVRINASISILNSLLETTQHSVTEEIVINDIYARTAIAYADTLIKELKKTEDDFEKLLEL